MIAENHCYFRENLIVNALAKSGAFGALYFGGAGYLHEMTSWHRPGGGLRRGGIIGRWARTRSPTRPTALAPCCNGWMTGSSLSVASAPVAGPTPNARWKIRSPCRPAAARAGGSGCVLIFCPTAPKSTTTKPCKALAGPANPGAGLAASRGCIWTAYPNTTSGARWTRLRATCCRPAMPEPSPTAGMGGRMRGRCSIFWTPSKTEPNPRWTLVRR